MLLAFGTIFAFIWIVGFTTGITFSGYIHVFLVAAIGLFVAHCFMPLRFGKAPQSCPDPRHQRRLARLLEWRPRPRKP
jgi:hypothetical protein